MSWYRLTSKDGELIKAELMVTPVHGQRGWYGGVVTWDDGASCRDFEDGTHVCIVKTESIEQACPQRCTKSCMR